jgi:hypothetical protein
LIPSPLWASAFRPFYLLGALYAPLLMGIWLGAYLGFWSPTPGGHALKLLHGHEFIYGFATAIISGVVLTALPSWAGTAEIDGHRLKLLVGLWLAGRVAFWSAPWLPAPLPALIDCLLFPSTILMLLPQLLRARNRLYLLLLPILLALFAGNLAYYQGIATGNEPLAWKSLRLAIYAIVVLYVLKGGVLAPVFTGNALREKGRGDQPAFLMPLEFAATIAVVLLAACDLGGAPPAWTGACALACTLLHAWRCARWQGLARGRRAAAAGDAPRLRLAGGGLRPEGGRRIDRCRARGRLAACLHRRQPGPDDAGPDDPRQPAPHGAAAGGAAHNARGVRADVRRGAAAPGGDHARPRPRHDRPRRRPLGRGLHPVFHPLPAFAPGTEPAALDSTPALIQTSTMNIAQLLLRAARVHPQRPALALGDRVLATYAELAQRVAQLAGGLAARLQPNDRVGLVMKNCPQYLELLFACWHAGLIAVPINAKLHPKELEFILADSGARLCFATADLYPAVSALRLEGLEAVIDVEAGDYEQLFAPKPMEIVPRAPKDAGWLFYTSGTTGRPKGVTLTQRNMMAAVLNYLADLDGIEPGDAIIHAAPMSHGSGFYILPHVAAPGSTWCRLRAASTRGNLRAAAGPSWRHDVRRADHGQAPGRASGTGRLPRAQDHRLWRRPDVRCRLRGGAAPLRLQAGANLRPGGVADDHHLPGQGAALRPRPPALRPASGLGGPRLQRRRSTRRRCR